MIVCYTVTYMDEKRKLSTESYKGVRDFYPEDEAVQKYMFAAMRRAVERFGYAEYNASVLEPAEMYRAKGAENAEMINEQTYTFTDRGEREVTLRPEMTPTAARMVAGRRRELAFPLRWYSIPNVFRYERPQRGRLREHWQLNVDLFGSNSLASDAEIIAVAHAIMLEMGASTEDFAIKISDRKLLDAFFERYKLSPEQGKAVRTLLDRKNKIPASEFAEQMEMLVGEPLDIALEPDESMSAMLAILAERGIKNVEFDPTIVRGFDYYTGIVFEVYDTNPENRRALFGGGRYDNLLSLFSDENVPAVGFGMGDVSARDFLEVRGLIPAYVPPACVYIAIATPDDKSVVSAAGNIAAVLRASGINTAVDFGDKKLGDQIKSAVKQKIPYCIVVGTDELTQDKFSVRNLMTGEEDVFSLANLSGFFVQN